MGLRPGTQDLRAIIALSAATSALLPNVRTDAVRVGMMANKLYAALCEHPRIHATMGDWSTIDRLPGIVSIYVEGMDSEELILQLDGRGFEVSAGSACSSGSLDASHVLLAMGVPREDALGSLRISFDDRVDERDLDRFARAVWEVWDRCSSVNFFRTYSTGFHAKTPKPGITWGFPLETPMQRWRGSSAHSMPRSTRFFVPPSWELMSYSRITLCTFPLPIASRPPRPCAQARPPRCTRRRVMA